MEAGGQFALSDRCNALLEQLKRESIGPSTDRHDDAAKDLVGDGVGLDLDGYHDTKIFKAKRFRQEVISQDGGVREAEQGRLHELRELLVVCIHQISGAGRRFQALKLS